MIFFISYCSIYRQYLISIHIGPGSLKRSPYMVFLKCTIATQHWVNVLTSRLSSTLSNVSKSGIRNSSSNTTMSCDNFRPFFFEMCHTETASMFMTSWLCLIFFIVSVSAQKVIFSPSPYVSEFSHFLRFVILLESLIPLGNPFSCFHHALSLIGNMLKW